MGQIDTLKPGYMDALKAVDRQMAIAKGQAKQ
jgi:hypothetical protein